MFGSAALSNHGCFSEYELMQYGDDGYYGEGGGSAGSFTRDPLYYHLDVTDVLTIVSESERFFTVAVEKMLDKKPYTFDIPRKIVIQKLGRVYVHKSIFADILKRERDRPSPKGKYAHLFEDRQKDAPCSEEVEVTSVYSGVWSVTYKGEKYTTTKESLTLVDGCWTLNSNGSRLHKVSK